MKPMAKPKCHQAESGRRCDPGGRAGPARTPVRCREEPDCIRRPLPPRRPLVKPMRLIEGSSTRCDLVAGATRMGAAQRIGHQTRIWRGAGIRFFAERTRASDSSEGELYPHPDLTPIRAVRTARLSTRWGARRPRRASDFGSAAARRAPEMNQTVHTRRTGGWWRIRSRTV